MFERMVFVTLHETATTTVIGSVYENEKDAQETVDLLNAGKDASALVKTRVALVRITELDVSSDLPGMSTPDYNATEPLI